MSFRLDRMLSWFDKSATNSTWASKSSSGVLSKVLTSFHMSKAVTSDSPGEVGSTRNEFSCEGSVGSEPEPEPLSSSNCSKSPMRPISSQFVALPGAST
jgi:hypothetical protein